MNMNDIRIKAREGMEGFCKLCKLCDGHGCVGEVPGMGGAGSGASFKANVDSLRELRLNMRSIHSVKQVTTKFNLFGKELSMPILAAPMTGVSYNIGGKLSEDEFIEMIIAGSLAVGTMGTCGDGADPMMYTSGINSIKKHNGFGIAIIKPRAQEEIIKKIRQAEDAGATAVGMDIDGAGLVTMALKGQPVGPKTPDELREIISSTSLPFIIKGIMTSDEAKICAEVGVKGIVVSNHGGRVIDHTPGTAEVLPEISSTLKSMKSDMVIFVDGGIRSGWDVLKMLALGANAVLIGRPVTWGAFGGGIQGVSTIFEQMKSELVRGMLLTGTSTVQTVSKDVLFHTKKNYN